MRHFNHFSHSFEDAVFTETRTGEMVVDDVRRWNQYLKLFVFHLRFSPYLSDYEIDQHEEAKRKDDTDAAL